MLLMPSSKSALTSAASSSTDGRLSSVARLFLAATASPGVQNSVGFLLRLAGAAFSSSVASRLAVRCAGCAAPQRLQHAHGELTLP